MSEIIVEEPVEQRSGKSVLIGVVSWYFVIVGVLGLIAITVFLGSGPPQNVLPGPASIAAVVVTRIGLILAGLQLRRRKRAAGIAAVVMFALPLLGSLLAGAVPGLVQSLSAVLGIGLIAAVWRDLKSD
jgi:hypothetical protein